MYLSSLTFHTAHLHWLVRPDTNDININGSYQIVLTEDNMTSNSSSLRTAAPSPLNFSVEIRDSFDDDNLDNDVVSLRYDIGLYGLKRGMRYRVDMSIHTNIGSSLHNVATTDFTTLNYGK